MAGPRVLLAGGDPDPGTSLARRLQGAGFEVSCARSGAEALGLLEKSPPAVALLDLSGPGRSWLEVCRAARRAPWGRELPILVLAGSADRKAVEEAARLGASGFLLNPFRFEDLLAEIRRHLGGEEPASPEGGIGPKLAAVLEKVGTLPPVPMTTQRLLDVLDNPSAGAKDLAKVILLDPAVTAQVLRIGNSAYYGQQERISDVTKAVILVGFSEISHTLMALSMSGLFARRDGRKEVLDRKAFWEHSLGCSMAASHLARHAGIGDPNQAMVSGLLHDLGKLVLASFLPSEYGEILKRAASERRHVRDLEREAFGGDHALVGQALAERWNLPPAIHRSIRHHHAPLSVGSLDHGTVELVRVVSVADALVKAGGIATAGDGLIEEVPERVLSLLMLNQKVAASALEAGRKTVAAHRSATGRAPAAVPEAPRAPVVLLFEGVESVVLSAFAVEAAGAAPVLVRSWGDALRTLEEAEAPGILVVDGTTAPSRSWFLETALRWRGARRLPRVVYLGPGGRLDDLPALPALQGCPKPLSVPGLREVLLPADGAR